MESMQIAQQHLLDNEAKLEMAGSGKRLANYIIDLLSFYFVLVLIGIFIGLTNPELIDYLNDTSPGKIIDRLVSIILYGVYMGALEAAFKGRTLGKVITGTVAVNVDGTPISSATAFKRGFSRAVPFCALSGLGTPCHPWQDKWTDTYVVDIKSSILPGKDEAGQ